MVGVRREDCVFVSEPSREVRREVRGRGKSKRFFDKVVAHATTIPGRRDSFEDGGAGSVRRGLERRAGTAAVQRRLAATL